MLLFRSVANRPSIWIICLNWRGATSKLLSLQW
jgi:hypothetical protein